ncbi:MAG TPA: RloB family protein, partial [Deltaproteobacteria bacterium]|nr:RloB family protein [Deltaproteobacteria bacterium]
PSQVLKRMRKYLKEEALRAGDEAWLVIDKDNWRDEQLTELHQWSKTHDNYGLAVSNPKFEYWLLLHFEDGNDVSSSRDCSDRLSRHLPDYDKGRLAVAKFIPGITVALERARRKDTLACEGWPRTTGTTVYRLVEKLNAGRT